MIIDNSTRQKLTDSLKILYPLIVKNSKKPFDKENILFASVNTEGTHIVFFTVEEHKSYLKFIDVLLSVEKIKMSFSKNFIKNSLTDILHQLLQSKKNELDKVITKQISSLEEKLSGEINNEWLIIFPLENIRITDNELKNISASFKIASSTIYRFNQEEKERIEKLFGIKFGDTTHIQLNNKICIETRVFSGDIEKVEEIGYLEIDEAINFLRLFIPWLKVDVEGRLSRKATFIKAINLRTKQIHTCSFGGGEPITNQYYINQGLYEYLDKNGLSLLNKIYENNDSNNYANKIKTAIHWFGSAVKDRLDRDKFLKLIICLETLLKKNNETNEITKTISERLSLLLGIDFNHRKDIFKDMKDLYRIRSAIVHGGKKDVEEDKLNLLIEYAASSIVKILNKYEQTYGFEKMIDDLDDLKFKIDNKFLW